MDKYFLKKIDDKSLQKMQDAVGDALGKIVVAENVILSELDPISEPKKGFGPPADIPPFIAIEEVNEVKKARLALNHLFMEYHNERTRRRNETS